MGGAFSTVHNQVRYDLGLDKKWGGEIAVEEDPTWPIYNYHGTKNGEAAIGNYQLWLRPKFECGEYYKDEVVYKNGKTYDFPKEKATAFKEFVKLKVGQRVKVAVMAGMECEMYEMEVADKEKDDSGKIDTVHVYYEYQ